MTKSSRLQKQAERAYGTRTSGNLLINRPAQLWPGDGASPVTSGPNGYCPPDGTDMELVWGAGPGQGNSIGGSHNDVGYGYGMIGPNGPDEGNFPGPLPSAWWNNYGTGTAGFIPAITRATQIIVSPIVRNAWEMSYDHWATEVRCPHWIHDPMGARTSFGPSAPALPSAARLTEHDYWSTVLVHALWWGRGVMLFQVNESNTPIQGTFQILNPFLVHERGGHYVIAPDTDSETVFDFDGTVKIGNTRWCIRVMRGLPPHLEGDAFGGVLIRHGKAFGIGAKIQAYEGQTFNTGIPSGVLQVSKPNFTPDASRALLAEWNKAHGGDRRGVAVLSAGVTFSPVSLNPVETDLSKIKQSSLVDIAHAFGISASWLDTAGGDSNCVDTETEALTKRGWLRQHELVDGDEFLTLNHETGLSEWQSGWMNRFAVKDCDMIHMESSVHDSLTTDDHKWPVLSHGKRIWRLTKDLTKNDAITLATQNADLPVDPTYDDSIVELVAWYYTEGYLLNKKGNGREVAGISQSLDANPEMVTRIDRALGSLFSVVPQVERGGEGSQRNRVSHALVIRKQKPDGMVTWRLNPTATMVLSAVFDDMLEKVPSREFIQSLTKSQLQLFIETSIDADGCRTTSSVSFKQYSDRRMEVFQLACILDGRPFNVVGDKSVHMKLRSITKPVETAIAARKRKGKKRVPTAVVEAVKYTGIIWCPTVDNGSWLARRNGRVYYTGNTYANLVDRRRDLVDHTLAEWGESLMQVIDTMLPAGQRVRVRWRDYQAADFGSVLKQAIEGKASGLLTDDEARALMGYMPLEGTGSPNA